MEEERSRLADLIEKHAISYSNEPFTLASGAKSNFYFDLRQVSGDAEGITAIARLLYNMITKKLEAIKARLNTRWRVFLSGLQA